MKAANIHPDTSLGHVHLTVASLALQLPFYQYLLGLKLRRRAGGEAALGAGAGDLLRFSELRAARRVPDTTGLYHLALQLPSRRELARLLLRLRQRGYSHSPTDHVFTKSIYCNDPEGNGIEVYAESPEDGSASFADGRLTVLSASGELQPAVEALDEEALLAELPDGDDPQQPLPGSTRIGHVNLYVADLERSQWFYRDLLGFEDRGLIASMGLAMVAAGGYHHHIAFNRWQGPAAPPPGSLGLRHFSILLPDVDALRAALSRLNQAGIAAAPHEGGWLAEDPSQNGILFIARATHDATGGS